METMTFFAPCGNLMIDRSTRCLKCIRRSLFLSLLKTNKQNKNRLIVGQGRLDLGDQLEIMPLWVKRVLKKPKGVPGAEGPPTKLNKTESKTKP